MQEHTVKWQAVYKYLHIYIEVRIYVLLSLYLNCIQLNATLFVLSSLHYRGYSQVPYYFIIIIIIIIIITAIEFSLGGSSP